MSMLLEQVGGEAVAQGVRRHALGDPGSLCRGMAGARELARRHRVDRVLTGKQPALRGRSRIAARWPHLPPLSQEIEHLGRQHDVAILAALGLLDPNDLLTLSICLTFSWTTSPARRPQP